VIAALRMPRDQRWYRLSVGALVVSAWAALASGALRRSRDT